MPGAEALTYTQCLLGCAAQMKVNKGFCIGLLEYRGRCRLFEWHFTFFHAQVMLWCRYVYQHEAVKELGRTKAFGVLSAGEWLRGKGHAVKSQFLAAKGAIDLMQVCLLPCSRGCRF